MIVREMTQPECEALVAESRIARLACSRDGEPYVVPVSVAYAPPCLYGFSMPGQKIDWMRANPKVCVLVEKFGETREWRSVVIYGAYEELPDRIGSKLERDRAWSALKQHANWWEPGGLKPVPGPAATASTHLFYRINIERMTGRQAVDDEASGG
jgi:uncharacterized protein